MKKIRKKIIDHCIKNGITSKDIRISGITINNSILVDELELYERSFLRNTKIKQIYSNIIETKTKI